METGFKKKKFIQQDFSHRFIFLLIQWSSGSLALPTNFTLKKRNYISLHIRYYYSSLGVRQRCFIHFVGFSWPYKDLRMETEDSLVFHRTGTGFTLTLLDVFKLVCSQLIFILQFSTILHKVLNRLPNVLLVILILADYDAVICAM